MFVYEPIEWMKEKLRINVRHSIHLARFVRHFSYVKFTKLPLISESFIYVLVAQVKKFQVLFTHKIEKFSNEVNVQQPRNHVEGKQHGASRD